MIIRVTDGSKTLGQISGDGTRWVVYGDSFENLEAVLVPITQDGIFSDINVAVGLTTLKAKLYSQFVGSKILAGDTVRMLPRDVVVTLVGEG